MIERSIKTLRPHDIEVKLLLEGIYLRYGYDFRNYSEASIRRRIAAVMAKHSLTKVSDLIHELLYAPDFFAAALPDLTVNTSEMFRDPTFFKGLRQEVIPALRTYPSIKIWHAGCSTGEEVYSLAILLEEEGLLDKSLIYATDINLQSLKSAKDGIYSAESVKQFTLNYQQAGGTRSFSEYYSALYGSVKFDARLRENIVFADHNLVTDEVFSQMHLILCRNVLIYFNRELQNRVLNLFTRSLLFKGYLCLGLKETVRFSNVSDYYTEEVPGERIFKKSKRDAMAIEATEP